MESAKIQLSAEELALAIDPGVILIKNAVIARASDLLGDLSAFLQDETRELAHGIADAIDPGPKISRGENYLGLPYVILDFPRYFREHDIFAVRTMFWWGNFFSMTLHLKGNYRGHFRSRLTAAREKLATSGHYIGVAEDEWEHHFGEDNYLPLTDLDEESWERLWNARAFTKIARKWPVSDWNEGVEDRMRETFLDWKQILGLGA
jgi:hypothetical protein